MSMVGFPLLLIPLAVYNIIAFLMPGVGFTEPLLQLRLVSGEFWPISLGDMLVAFGILMLLLEIIKAAGPRGRYLTDHLLSLLVFGAAAAEFVMWPKFASSTFFMLTLLAMVDFFAGIALRSTRRAPAVVAAPIHTPDPEPAPVLAAPANTEVPTPVTAPAPAEPAPLPATESDAVPPATSVAESVLLDHSAPSPAPAAIHEPAPQAAAPELEPAVTTTPAAAETPPDQSEAPKP